MMTWRIVLVALAVVLLTTVLSGCTAPSAQGEIKSPEEAKQTIRDVSQDVQDLGETLADIENSL